MESEKPAVELWPGINHPLKSSSSSSGDQKIVYLMMHNIR
ncbi:hypothetical protein SFOMI_5025 [Sphingobium fuliginis]|jgi:hypothetical protein|uniref:Uncharacterized protein n=1 Tax=Sphingobium fuliginis (strain ATCC 27551) TaxID=336203 RepID=A0A292ZNL0_SPHSA|nr:hypothetical protein SFOMI_5025 [Sphingobium fuliginis]